MPTTTLDDRTRTLDTEDTAARVGVTAETLRNWRWKGDGPPYLKIGRTVRYSLADLAEWLDSRRRTSTSDAGPSA